MGRKIKSGVPQYLNHFCRQLLRMNGLWFSIRLALLPAALCAMLATSAVSHHLDGVMPEKEIYTALSALVSLCVVFHTVQSYSRFMSGVTMVYQFHGSLYETAAMIVIFAKNSKNNVGERQKLYGTLIRLISMLFAFGLAELEDCASAEQKDALTYDLLDPKGLDVTTLRLIHDSADKALCVYHRLLDLMMHSLGDGVVSIAPPIFSRALHELELGMNKYHEALKFKDAPFPFSFMIVTESLLLMFTLFTPFMFARWTGGPVAGAIFTFFMVAAFWLLHCVAHELENPFGHDSGDLQAEKLLRSLNERLVALTEEAEADAPHLAESAISDLGAALRSDIITKGSHSIRETFWQLKGTNSFTSEPSVKKLVLPSSENGEKLVLPSSETSAKQRENTADRKVDAEKTTTHRHKDDPYSEEQIDNQIPNGIDGTPLLSVSVLTPRMIPWRTPRSLQPHEACKPSTPAATPRYASDEANAKRMRGASLDTLRGEGIVSSSESGRASPDDLV